MKLLQIFGTVFGKKTSSSIFKSFWCPDEAQKCDRWVLAWIYIGRSEVAFFEKWLSLKIRETVHRLWPPKFGPPKIFKINVKDVFG